MPNFTTAAPKEATGRSLRLIRTPSPGAFVGIITCTHMVGCPTHYWHQRTVPCEAPNCEPCSEGYPWRWHGYVTCVAEKSNEHLLFEVTAQASEQFTEYHKRHGTLLGCQFRAERAGGKTNGRVLIRTKPADLQKTNLPSPPDIIKSLSHIWNIPTRDITEEGLQKDTPRLNVKQTDPATT